MLRSAHKPFPQETLLGYSQSTKTIPARLIFLRTCSCRPLIAGARTCSDGNESSTPVHPSAQTGYSGHCIHASKPQFSAKVEDFRVGIPSIHTLANLQMKLAGTQHIPEQALCTSFKACILEAVKQPASGRTFCTSAVGLAGLALQ